MRFFARSLAIACLLAGFAIVNAVPVAAQTLGFSKAFSPATIAPGGTSMLTYTIAGPGGGDFFDIAFTDNLSGFLGNDISTVTDLPQSGFCGFGSSASASVSNGELILSVTGATLTGDDSRCELVVAFTVPADLPLGDYTSRTSDLSAMQGLIEPQSVTSAAAEATLTVSPPAAAPGFAKAFSPDRVDPGEVSTLTFTIDNRANAIAVGSLAFTDAFPDGMVVAGTPDAVTTCGGTFSPVAGDATLDFSGGSVAAGESCTLSVDVQALRAVTLENVSGGLTSDLPVAAPGASAILEVDEAPLSVSMSFSPSTIGQRDVSRLTYELRNGAAVAATLILLSDTLPDNLVLADPSNAQTTCTGGTLTAAAGGSEVSYSDDREVGSLPSNSACTIAVNVTSTVAGSYTNNTESVISSLGTSAAAEATLTVSVPTADLAVTVTDATDPILPGARQDYTVQVTNNGPRDAPDVVGTFTLPAGATFVSTSGCAGDPNGLTTCALGSIAASDSASYTVTATIDGSTAGTITASATAESTATGPAVVDNNAENDTGSEETVVTPTADLAVTVTDATDPILPGARQDYTVQITNNGPRDAPDVVGTFTLPAGATFVSTSGCAGDPDGLTTCALGSIAASDSASYTVTATIDGSTAGTITASATAESTATGPAVVDNNAENDTGSEETVVTPTADLAVTVTDATDPILPGARQDYTVQVTNNGPRDAPDVVGTFTLPAGATFVSTSGCAGDPDGLTTCALGSIAASDSASYTVTATIDGSTTGLRSPRQRRRSGRPDQPWSADRRSRGDRHRCDRNGATIRFKSPITAHGTPPTLSAPSRSPRGRPSFTLGSIAASDSASYTVTATIDGSTTGTITASATAESTATGPAVVDNNAENDTGSEETVVTPTADLAVTVTDATDPILPGARQDYTVQVTNNGPRDAPDVVGTFTLPAGATFVSTSGCAGDPDGLTTCALGSIAASDSASYTVTATIDGSTAGTITASATAESTATGPAVVDNNAENDTGSEETVVTPTADLAVTVTDATDPILPGARQDYTVQITNNGPRDAPDVVGTFTLPAGATFVSTSGCAGDPDGLTTCALGSIAASDSASYTVTATIDGSTAGTITASATAESTATGPAVVDDNAENDTGSEETVVTPVADISVTNDDGLTSVDAGGTVTYRIVAANNGPSADPDVSLTDRFPDGLTCSYTSVATGGASGNTAAGEGDVSEMLSLPVDGEVVYTATCTVDGSAAGTLSNTATVDGSLTDPDNSNDSATDGDTVINPAAAPGFAKAFSPARVDPGGVSTLTFTIDNGANLIDVGGLAFTDAFPDGMVVAGPPNGSTTCGGTFAPAASATSLAFSGGSVAAGRSCTLSVAVQALRAGTLENVSGGLTSDLPVAAPPRASATLTVNPAAAPGFARVFSPDTIGQGRETEIVFTIDNEANAIALTGMGFDDSLPSGVSVADTPAADNSCGGTFSPVAGDATLAFTGGGLDAGATCELRVRVRALAAGTLTDPAVALTSSVATATAPSATLTVNPAVAPGFARVFSPDTIGQGRETEIVFTIDNEANAIALTGMGFDDSLPSGVSVADTPAADNSCGGTFSPVAGDATLAFTGGGLDAGATCELRVRVRALAAGTLTDPAVALTSSVATATAPSATLTVNPAVAPGFAKAFSPATVDPGGVSTLTFTIDNSQANAIDVGSLAFTDAFPDGMVVAGPPNAVTTCGGTFAPAASATSLAFSGGSVAAGQSCTLSVAVQALRAGTLENVSDELTSELPVAAPGASATLTVAAAAAPGFAKAFSPARVDPGGVSTLTFTIDNEANAIAVGSLAFTDAFPDGMVVAGPPNGSTTCGGTFAPAASATSLAFSGGSVAAGQSCTLSVAVQALRAGTLENVSDELTSELPVAAPGASATLTVAAAAAPGFAKAFSPARVDPGGVSTLTFTIDNEANAIAVGSLAFTDAFPEGLAVAGPPNGSTTCGGTFAPAASATSLAFSGGSVAAGRSCTLSVAVQALRAGTLENVSGELTSELPVAAPGASATLTVAAAAAPGFAKAFSPARVDPGGVSTLTFTIDNGANLIDVGGLAFTDAFPEGLAVAGTPNGSTTCGGTFAPAASATSLAFSGGSVAAAGTCTLSVDVRALVAGTLTGTSGELTSDLPVAAPGASATLEVNEAPLSVSLSFEPTEIGAGGVSRLTYGLDNGAAVEATSVALSDRLPDNVVLAPELNADNSCGGTLTAAAGGSEVSWSGGSLAAGADCTIAVDVTSTVAGSYTNGPESATSSLGTSTPAEATLTVEAAVAPGFAKAFSPATVDPGRVSTLTFTIDNEANAIAVGSLAFTDAFPEGLAVSVLPNGSTTCGGTFAPAASAPDLAFSGGSVAAGQSCTLSVDVRALVAGTLTGTSGELTSDLPVAAPGASATLEVNEAPLSVSMSFEPTEIGAGGVSRLTYGLDNGAAVEATSVALSDRLPDNVVLAPELNADNSCGGTLTAAAGGSEVSWSGGSLAAGADCTIAVDVTSTVAGSYTNGPESATSSLGTSTPAEATLTVEAAVAPGFAKAFSPATVDPGGVSTLTFTIDNEANAIAVGSLAFTDAFPEGLAVSVLPNGSTTCGGTFAPAASAPELAFSGGSVAAGQSCTLSVDVRALVAGTLTGTSGELTSDLPVAAPGTSATLEVNEAPLSVSMSFEPTEIGAGGVSRLTYGLDNGAAVEATSVALSDRLPDNVVLAPELNADNSCGGTLTAAAGGSEVSWSGGSLAAGADCTIAVDVTSTVAGSYTNGPESATSSLGTSTPAEATLTVEAAVAPGFAKAFSPATVDPGGVSTLTFTIDNGANLIDVGGLAFTDAFPEGLAVSVLPNGSTTCGGTFAPAASATSLDFSGGSVAAAGTCTLSVDVRALVAGTLTGTSGELTSDLPVAAPGASATLEVNEAPLSVSMSFEPTEIGAGGVSRLTYGLDNGAAVEATSVALSDRLPDNVVLAPELNADNSCGGTLTAAAGGSEVSWSGGSLAAGADCTIAVDVTSTVAGSYTNGPESATSSLGTSAAAEATLTVEAAVAPGFAKAFSPATVDPGRISTLTFTIDNEANAIAVGSLAFTDAFPEGLAVSVLPNGSTTCGGTFAPDASATSLDFSGGSVAAGQSCTLSVDVRALVAGTLTGTSGELTSDLPVAAPGASATLEVNEVPLSVSMSFSPSTIGQGGVSRLTYGLDNGAAVEATSVALSDRLPDNVVLAGVPNAQTTCTGGTLTAAAGGGRVSWSGGSLAAGAACTIAVDVTSAVAGSYPNGTESATSSLGTSAAAEAMLTVDAAGAGTVTLDVESDTDGIFSFSSAEPVLTLSLEVKGGAGSTGALAVATGSYSVAVAAPTGVALTAIACDDTDSTADVSAAMISVTVDASEAVTCTLTAQSSVQPTVEAINSFLTRRTDLILSSESDPRRRFERLNRGSGQASPVRYSKGDLKALVPFTVQGGISFTERQDGNGSFKVSTSLLQARQAAASAALASGPAGDVAYVENYRFGAWLEAQYKQFGGDADKHGDFAIAYFGMDYLVKPDVLVGALVSLDTMEEVTDTSKVSGFGYMFGPYMTARLTSNLYFDGHVAIGRSDNRVSPFNTYTDTFQTRRWLARASLTGEARHGNWTIQPHVRLAYFEERQQRYVDSVGATIPRQTVRLGQLKIGPTFTGRFEGPEGWSYAPYLGVEGIYNIGDTTGVTLTDTSGPEVEGWRARLKAGVGLTAEQGTRLSLGASHDGLGRSDFENWGLNFELSIPFGKPAR